MVTPKERIAELLLEELKNGTMEWYYVSVADETFHHGYLVQGMGPTDAWQSASEHAFENQRDDALADLDFQSALPRALSGLKSIAASWTTAVPRRQSAQSPTRRWPGSTYPSDTAS